MFPSQPFPPINPPSLHDGKGGAERQADYHSGANCELRCFHTLCATSNLKQLGIPKTLRLMIIYIYTHYIYICIVLFDGASILNDHSMIFTEHCWFMISFIYVICSRSRATPFLLVTSDWFRIYNNIHIINIYIYKYILVYAHVCC